MESQSLGNSLHIAMYPWFALGHITPFLHLANKLAQRNHKISFLVPTNTQSKIQMFNNFPNLITFVPITVPHVEGLPTGAETTADVAGPQMSLLMTAMDRTEPYIEALLQCLRPQVILFDFTFWIPKLARRLGIKSMFYSILSVVTMSYNYTHLWNLKRREFSVDDLMRFPPGFPDSSIKIHRHEAQTLMKMRSLKFGGDVLFYDRLLTGIRECDALCLKACREIEGPFIDHVERRLGKPILVAGHVIPERPVSTLEERWVIWLDKFKPNSVLYCALGSEITLSKDQFRELVLGLELSGSPFLAAMRPPIGCESVEEALPEGFEERVGERGLVHQGWIQQPLILEHPSVGCFFTHSGSGSLIEGLVNGCDLVLLPFYGDHIFATRLIGNSLKAGVEVERNEDDGSFTRESVCGAIRTVMDQDYSGHVWRDVRANRAKLTEILRNQGLWSSYIDEFTHMLRKLVAD